MPPKPRARDRVITLYFMSPEYYLVEQRRMSVHRQFGREAVRVTFRDGTRRRVLLDTPTEVFITKRWF